jgi:hypothetical protein
MTPCGRRPDYETNELFGTITARLRAADRRGPGILASSISRFFSPKPRGRLTLDTHRIVDTCIERTLRHIAIFGIFYRIHTVSHQPTSNTSQASSVVYLYDYNDKSYYDLVSMLCHLAIDFG